MTTWILKFLFGCFIAFVMLEAVVFGVFCLPVLALHWIFFKCGFVKQEVDEDFYI